MPEERFPEDYYAKYDPYNMRGAILDTPLLAEKGYGLVEALDLGKLKKKYHSVVIAGMLLPENPPFPSCGSTQATSDRCRGVWLSPPTAHGSARPPDARPWRRSGRSRGRETR